MRKLNNHKGFSLVELMIVVAIIGALAAIGLPAFQVFLKRSKQSEAKLQLATYYGAQKAFVAEWGTYFDDFDSIGFIPDGNQNYNVGLNAVTTLTLPGSYPRVVAATRSFSTLTYCGVPAIGATAAVAGIGAANVRCSTNAGIGNNVIAANYGAVPAGPGGTPAAIPGTTITMTNAAFIVGAVSNFDGDNTEDVWTMNQNRQLLLLSDDSAQ